MSPIVPENIRWHLKQIHSGRMFDVNETDNYMVGRNQTAQISLNSNKTSRNHSSFVVNVEGHLLVQDLKSLNGTFVNGTPLVVYVLKRVFPGDVISFGLANIDMSEDDRDRQTFFVVVHTDPPPVQDIPPPEEPHSADSTTDFRENVGSISVNNNQTSGKNITAEIKHPNASLLELPSTSGLKNEPVDIIDITNNADDEQKLDVDDVDDCFQEGEDEVNNHPAPQQQPEKKKVESNNWLCKLPSPKKIFRNRRSTTNQERKYGVEKRRVAEFFAASNNDTRRHTISDVSDAHSAHCSRENAIVSTSTENLDGNSKKKTDFKETSVKIERKRLKNSSEQQKEKDNSGGKKYVEIHEKINLHESHINKKTPKDVNNSDNLKSSKNHHVDHIQEHPEKSKESAKFPPRRKSLVESNLEKENHEHPNKKPQRRKSVGKDPSCIQKDVTSEINNQRRSKSPEEKGNKRKTESSKNSRSSVDGLERGHNEEHKTLSRKSNSSDLQMQRKGVNIKKSKQTDLQPADKVSRKRKSDINEHEKKQEDEHSSKGDDPQDQIKGSKSKHDKRVEKMSAEKISNQRKRSSSENKDNEEKKRTSDKEFSRRRKTLDSDDDHKKVDKNRKPNDENLLKRKITSSDDDLLIQLDRAISGKDGLAPQKDNNEKNEQMEKPKPVDKDIETNHMKKRESEKGEEITTHITRKRVKIGDDDEFNFNSDFGRFKNKVLEEKPLISNEDSTESRNNDSKEERGKNQNYSGKISLCNCNEPSTSYQACPIHSMHSDNRDKSPENNIENTGNDHTSFKDPNVEFKFKKSLEKSFTLDQDNSVIYDLTKEDDMDVSCSQIFHMSQIVKLEEQDDTFQKIKNELAEMDFCNEETIMNAVPIDLEDMSGFENTQDICAYLEDDGDDNKHDDKLISKEEHEELAQVLEESNKLSGNTDQVVDMEISFDGETSSKDNEEILNKSIDCKTFFGKPKFVKPPIIEAHTIVKTKKDILKKSPVKPVSKEENTVNKRKNSLETPTSSKKLKGSPRGSAERPRTDSKGIQMEFKKRNSGSKIDHNKVHKESIREERRKKLKEITERSIPTKTTEHENKYDKGKTVKVLPDSKTSRGNFLCEPLKKNDNAKKFNIPKSGVKHSECQCYRPGSSDKKCPVHNNDTKKEGHNRDLMKYHLKPIDFPKVPASKYNLRRTKSSGDIKADLAKSNDQLQPAETRYNLRHSTASVNNENNIPQAQDAVPRIGKTDPRIGRLAVPPQRAVVNPSSKPLYADQRLQYGSHGQHNYINSMTTNSMNGVSRGDLESARRLMWTNGGPSNPRRSPIKRLPGVDDVVQKMVHWLPNWLLEQCEIDISAPVNNPPATNIPLNFQNFPQYYDTFSKLILLENWQYLFKGFREVTDEPKKAKIEHVRVANDLMTLDCISYISQKELRQGHYFKLDDFLLLECIVSDKTQTYMSLSFGYIQKCYKSTISNHDLISVRLGNFCNGEPHSKLEFTLVTRHQPGREINIKKFPILKTLANIRGHLMLLRAVKGLVNSPICSKILHPKINEYRFAVTHQDIIQPHALNSQQKSIVLEAASLCTGPSDGIYCIKGPPGTGKSTVIVNLVFQILFNHYVLHKGQEPPMILLAAPSNTAVDNLLSKLTYFRHKLGPALDKYKSNIKCVRIGPEARISKSVSGWSLPRLSEKHVPLKYGELPEFKAAKERNENMLEFAKNFFGDRYGSEIKACEDLIIKKSNIICTTLNSCINGKLMEAVNRGLIKFTCCIIDEATQCHEVEALLPTILGISKFVLVGDPKQLNATIVNGDAYKLGFGESLFSRIANNFISDPSSPIRLLTDQYRMHPEICAFPNKHFYEGKLRSLPKPPNKLPEKLKPYLVFNCEKTSDCGSYTNIDEVHFIQKLLSTIFGMIDRDHEYTVGIISPYNAQKDLISSSIEDLALQNTNCKITVNTVDSFQGSENDIVIISCVRNSTNSFLQNENRLNVALTRAKQALYIIGNYTLFKECRTLYDLREDAKKRRLLLDIRQNPKTIDNFSKYLIKRNSKD